MNVWLLGVISNNWHLVSKDEYLYAEWYVDLFTKRPVYLIGSRLYWGNQI
jgi:hypothetical protein